MFTYTAKLPDGRLVAIVAQQPDGTYAVASALPHTDRNQASRNGFYALQAVSRGWSRKVSAQTQAYINELLEPIERTVERHGCRFVQRRAPNGTWFNARLA